MRYNQLNSSNNGFEEMITPLLQAVTLTSRRLIFGNIRFSLLLSVTTFKDQGIRLHKTSSGGRKCFSDLLAVLHAFKRTISIMHFLPGRKTLQTVRENANTRFHLPAPRQKRQDSGVLFHPTECFSRWQVNNNIIYINEQQGQQGGVS